MQSAYCTTVQVGSKMLETVSDGRENAEPDSRFWSCDAEKIVNESSIVPDDEDGNVDDGNLQNTPYSKKSENECIVDLQDEEITLCTLQKAINHSFVNLKRQNPLIQ